MKRFGATCITLHFTSIKEARAKEDSPMNVSATTPFDDERRMDVLRKIDSPKDDEADGGRGKEDDKPAEADNVIKKALCWVGDTWDKVFQAHLCA